MYILDMFTDFRNEKVTAPLKRTVQVCAFQVCTYFRNEKVTAPLKQLFNVFVTADNNKFP